MKTTVLFLLLITAFGIQISCASKKNAMDTNISGTLTTEDPSDSLFASLARGFCFGTCPVYEVKIYKSGFATYEGKANTDMIGTFTARFSKEQLASLTKVAKQINYASFEDVYDNPNITDLPEHTSSIVIEGKRKQVKRRIGHPQSILVFEKQIDELVSEAQWTPEK